MRFVLFGLLFLYACSPGNIKENRTDHQTKEQLISLEQKWIEAAFALDTTYISSLLDATFQSINADHILNKKQELDAIYKNISAMRKDSIFLDSVKLEDANVKLYDNTAVAIFIVYT